MRSVKLIWITLIYFFFVMLWFALGVKMQLSTKSVMSSGKDVISTKNWGGEIYQRAPVQYASLQGEEEIRKINDEEKLSKRLVSSTRENILVKINVEYKKKGLITYNTYTVDFSGDYEFVNKGSEPEERFFTFKLPDNVIMFSNLKMSVNEKLVEDDDISDGLNWSGILNPGEKSKINVQYSARGIDNWGYMLGKNIQHNNLDIDVIIVDGEAVLWEKSLSPTKTEITDESEKFSWQFTQLITDRGIGISVKKAMNPFIIAKNLSFFAPLSFFLYLVSLITMLIIRRKELHPVHFIFIGASYFVFNLLLSYLVQYISIPIAFGVSFIVSFSLIVSFLWRILDLRFTFIENGIFLILFLLIYPISFFTLNRGLILVISGVIALGMLMHLSARFKWEKENKTA
jgi:hypothetical protein